MVKSLYEANPDTNAFTTALKGKLLACDCKGNKGGGIKSIVAGKGITVDTTDSLNPKVSCDGTPGPKGAEGKVGATGPIGKQGVAGPVGPGGAGSVGREGPRGPAGTNGIDGATGATGATGPKGDKGDRGLMGPTGVGPAGPTGQGLTIRGTDTEANIKAKTGMAAGDLWVISDAGAKKGHGLSYDGTKWIDTGAIQGPKGARGDSAPASGLPVPPATDGEYKLVIIAGKATWVII